jgi:hypothetical protein
MQMGACIVQDGETTPIKARSPEPDTLFCQSRSLPSPEGLRRLQLTTSIASLLCISSLLASQSGIVIRVWVSALKIWLDDALAENFGTTMLGE